MAEAGGAKGCKTNIRFFDFEARKRKYSQIQNII
jgi:hypothetical protein